MCDKGAEAKPGSGNNVSADSNRLCMCSYGVVFVVKSFRGG